MQRISLFKALSTNLIKSQNQRYLASAVAATKSKINSEESKSEENKPKKHETKQNLSFMANIFRGELQSSQVFPYPNVLSDEEKEFTSSLVEPVENFFHNVNDAAKNDENCTIDEKTLNAAWELGSFGLQVPASFGGMGLKNTQYARMGEIVGQNDLGFGVMMGAHQSIGFKGILLFGTPEQKAKYLPKVAAEKVCAAFCLTEPSSGSDASSIRSKAVKSMDGKHYVLNGSKIWISNGGIADIFTVFAQTSVIDSKTGQPKDKITGFIVERGFEGVSNGPPEKKMGIKASNTAELYFDNVKIPVENVLGGEGNGFKVAMEILNNGRFGMGATLAGTMRHCIKVATDHANNRLQFGKKIKEFGAIQEKLARMTMLQYVTESMAYTIAQNMDGGSQDYHLEAAISKVFASESAWYVCDEAIQILGGMGFMKEAGLERFMRDIRIFRIFEGANEILKLFVALTGIQYAGSHLKELQKAFKNPAANLGLIFTEASKRAALSVGFGGTDLTQFVNSDLKSSAKLISECVDLFGQTVEELLVKYGKNIINEQYLLNRLAEAAIDIYGSVTVLSRSTRAAELNLPTTEHEILLTNTWCLEASDRIRKNLKKTKRSEYLEIYRKMTQISKDVCANDGVNTTHILTSK